MQQNTIVKCNNILAAIKKLNNDSPKKINKVKSYKK
jgi:hypothetical protein